MTSIFSPFLVINGLHFTMRQPQKIWNPVCKSENKGITHRAMFKLGGKKIFVLCLLVKNVSAVYGADRCDF